RTATGWRAGRADDGRRGPDRAAVGDSERGEAAALPRIENIPACVEGIRRGRSAVRGRGAVHPLAIARHAPLHADARTHIGGTTGDARLPQQLALLVGIEGVNHARLLTGKKN